MRGAQDLLAERTELSSFTGWHRVLSYLLRYVTSLQERHAATTKPAASILMLEKRPQMTQERLLCDGPVILPLQW